MGRKTGIEAADSYCPGRFWAIADALGERRRRTPMGGRMGAGRSIRPMPNCPKWRKKAHRPSCLDLIALMRKEMVESPDLIEQFSTKVTDSALIAAAAA